MFFCPPRPINRFRCRRVSRKVTAAKWRKTRIWDITVAPASPFRQNARHPAWHFFAFLSNIDLSIPGRSVPSLLSLFSSFASPLSAGTYRNRVWNRGRNEISSRIGSARRVQKNSKDSRYAAWFLQFDSLPFDSNCTRVRAAILLSSHTACRQKRSSIIS